LPAVFVSEQVEFFLKHLPIHSVSLRVDFELLATSAGLAGLFVWSVPSHADRDLVIQDSHVLLAGSSPS